MARSEHSIEKHRAYALAWRAANRERTNASARARYALSPEKINKATAEWQAKNPERLAYNAHKGGAKRRNIAFLLTFKEWLAIWFDSGKWEQRGRGSDQYCMARYGDAGPYAIGNVRICTIAENTSEAHLGKLRSDITRERLSISHSGKPRKPHSAETRKRMSIAAKARCARASHLRPP